MFTLAKKESQIPWTALAFYKPFELKKVLNYFPDFFPLLQMPYALHPKKHNKSYSKKGSTSKRQAKMYFIKPQKHEG